MKRTAGRSNEETQKTLHEARNLLNALTESPVNMQKISSAAIPGVIARTRRLGLMFFDTHQAIFNLGTEVYEMLMNRNCEKEDEFHAWQSCLCGPSTESNLGRSTKIIQNFQRWRWHSQKAVNLGKHGMLPWIDACNAAFNGDGKWLDECIRLWDPQKEPRRLVQVCALSNNRHFGLQAVDPQFRHAAVSKAFTKASKTKGGMLFSSQALSCLSERGSTSAGAVPTAISKGAVPANGAVAKRCAAACRLFGERLIARSIERGTPLVGHPSEASSTMLGMRIFPCHTEEAANKNERILAELLAPGTDENQVSDVVAGAAFSTDLLLLALSIAKKNGLRLPRGSQREFWAMAKQTGFEARKDVPAAVEAIKNLGGRVPASQIAKDMIGEEAFSFVETMSLASGIRKNKRTEEPPQASI